MLLDKGPLGSGSTSKAAGGVRAQFSDPVNIALGARSLETFRAFPSLLGHEIDFHQVGYLFLLGTAETVAAFEAGGDRPSARILERIFRDEIRHVRAGTYWFRTACESRELAVVAEWKRLVGAHFRGALKPPFNDSARDEAGLSREFYAGVARQ